MKTETPDRFSCEECQEEGKGIMHFAFSTLVDEMPDGLWSWLILNHDKTTKFEWPDTFKTKLAAEEFVLNLIDEAKESLGDTVV